MTRRQQQYVLASAAACAALALTAPARAQYEAPNSAYAAPATYYNAATSGDGATLKTQLNAIIKAGHTTISYDDLRETIPVYERDPANPSNVLLVYSGYSVQGLWSTGGTIWNREHMWCDSYGLAGSGKDYSDCFNVRPANPNVNSDRNNEYYTDIPVANQMVAHALAPECFEDKTISDVSTNQMWQPRQVEMGDVARGLFYMDTRYDGTEASTTDLTLTDDVSIINTGSPYMGKLTNLLHWHYQDGVTNEERRRNDIIYDSYQHNRNPFIDHPEYVWAVFGGGANNSRIYVGASNPSNGASATSANLRVIKGAASWGTSDVLISKVGVHPTTYDVTTSGNATTTAAGVGQSFVYDPTSRTIQVSLSGGTANVGSVTGTITINNTDLTTSSVGSGNGSEDGNDTISVNGTVLDNSQPSFASGVSGSAQTLDFGYVPVNGSLRTANFNVWNNPAAAGAEWTAGLDVDGASKTGSSLMSTTVTASNPATPLAATGNRVYLALYTPGAAEGVNSATHTIAVSDENIPGAVARPNLVLTTTGRTTAGSFPVSGNLFLFGGEDFVTTSFAVGDGATINKLGSGTMTIGGPQTHGANATFNADGGTVTFTTDANSTATSGLSLLAGSAPVTFQSKMHLRALNVHAANVVTVAQHGDHALVTGQLTIDPSAKLDLKDNDLIVRDGTLGSATAGVYDGVAGKIQSGRNGGAWTGDGILTSMPDAATGLTSLGAATGAQILGLGPTDTAVWNGETVAGADVLAMYTYAGDANLDGFISGDDYSSIDFNISVADASGWYNGDFNYDGIISGDDYSTIDFNIVAQGAPLGSSSAAFSGAAVVAVPEPAACLFAILTVPLMMSRRRRRV